MDWLVPQDNIRPDLNNIGYDTLYKPYAVEPLVSRFSYNTPSSLGGQPIGSNPGSNRRAQGMSRLRNAALDDIDELTLAVETKNFLGSKAVAMPSYNNAAGNPSTTSIYTANPSQINNGGGGGGYDANQALFTSLYDNQANNLYQNYLNNPVGPNFDDQLYNPNQFQ
jgi:hypothetical protein